MPQVDWARIDATTEEEIAAQVAADEAEAMRDAAAYGRRVRRKGGLPPGRVRPPHRLPVDICATGRARVGDVGLMTREGTAGASLC